MSSNLVDSRHLYILFSLTGYVLAAFLYSTLPDSQTHKSKIKVFLPSSFQPKKTWTKLQVHFNIMNKKKEGEEGTLCSIAVQRSPCKGFGTHNLFCTWFLSSATFIATRTASAASRSYRVVCPHLATTCNRKGAQPVFAKGLPTPFLTSGKHLPAGNSYRFLFFPSLLLSLLSSAFSKGHLVVFLNAHLPKAAIAASKNCTTFFKKKLFKPGLALKRLII